MAGSVELVLLLIYTARYLFFSVMALGVVIQSYANELGNWTATKLHIVQPSLLLLSYCPTAARLQCCYVVPPRLRRHPPSSGLRIVVLDIRISIRNVSTAAAPVYRRGHLSWRIYAPTGRLTVCGRVSWVVFASV